MKLFGQGVKRMQCRRTLVAAMFVCFAVTPLVAADSMKDLYKTHAELSSVDLRAIEIAKRELHKLRRGWTEYQISVIETNTSLLVSFWRPDMSTTTVYTQPQPNGAPTIILATQERAHDSLVVELDKRSLRLIGTTNTP
jgi:hypothetical protein